GVLGGARFGARHFRGGLGGFLLAVVLPDQHEQRQRQAHREAESELAPTRQRERNAAAARALEVPAGDLRSQDCAPTCPLTCFGAPTRRGGSARCGSPAVSPAPG